MKIFNCFKLALTNIKTYKKFYFKITVPIMLIAFLLLFSSLYVTNLNRKIDERYNRFYSRYYGEINTESQLNETLLNLSKYEGGIVDIKSTVNLESSDFTFYKDMELEIDGIKKSSEYERRPNLPDFNLTFVTKGSHISKNEEKELFYRNKKEILLFGSYDVSGNKAVVNELLFEIYNMDIDENIIGKTITFYKNEQKYFDMTVSGVTTKYIFDNSMYLNTLIGLSTESDLYKINSDLDRNYTYRFFFNDYLSAQRSFGYLCKIFPEEKIVFPYELEIKIVTSLYSQKAVINKFINVILTVMFLAFFLNMIFNIRIKADKQKGYIGMMKGLGITNFKMYLIMFFEFLIILFIALITAIILTSLSLNIINGIFDSAAIYKGVTIIFDFSGFYLIILSYACIFILLSLLLSLISFKLIYKKSAIALIKN